MSENVLVITGPTATGKTALSVALAKKLNGEIVSADSMQIYRGMDIGTAKVTTEEMAGIPHHLIDVAEPTENFSVSRYVDLASSSCDDILSRGKVPVIVGGTGLYVDSLLSGRTFAERSPEENDVRQKLNEEYESLGAAVLWDRLKSIDPERAEKLSPNDKKRIVRALEIYQLTGKTISQHDKETRRLPPRYRSLRFALDFNDREVLYQRINDRVDTMVENGLFEEVDLLLKKGLSPECTAMQAIGYKEPAMALRGTITREDAIEQIKKESRRYAKRQLTWLRRDPDLQWIRWETAPNISEAVDFCSHCWDVFISEQEVKE